MSCVVPAVVLTHLQVPCVMSLSQLQDSGSVSAPSSLSHSQVSFVMALLWHHWPCHDPDLFLSPSLNHVPFPVPCPSSASPEIDHWCPIAIKSLYITSLLRPDLCEVGGQSLLGMGASVRALRMLKIVTASAQPPLGPPPIPARGPGPHFSSGMVIKSLLEQCCRYAFLQPCLLDGPFGPPL